MTVENNKYYRCEKTDDGYLIKNCANKPSSALTFLREVSKDYVGEDPRTAIQAVYDGYLKAYAERWFFIRWAESIINTFTYLCGLASGTDIQKITDLYKQIMFKEEQKEQELVHKMMANEFFQLKLQDYSYLVTNLKKYPANLAQLAKVWPKLPKDLRGHRKAVLTFVALNGLLLKDASEEMRKDPIVIKTAVLKSFEAIAYAIYTKENAQEYMTLAIIALRRFPYLQKHVTLDPFIAKFKDNKTNDDKDYVVKIVGLLGNMIKYASERLQKDADVIKAAEKARNKESYCCVYLDE